MPKMIYSVILLLSLSSFNLVAASLTKDIQTLQKNIDQFNRRGCEVCLETIQGINTETQSSNRDNGQKTLGIYNELVCTQPVLSRPRTSIWKLTLVMII